MIGKFVSFFNLDLALKTLFIVSILMTQSCSKIYLGSHNQQYFDEINQPDELGEIVKRGGKMEPGQRFKKSI
ncbi:MAG: hypothetical protein Ct9H90mP7_4810 [Candidatus Neomarinimicrobiota bacterium]|nr:MAG: hypothetical protein Ct9H90mP7_4810 [Candidatus Neomarinimicrobiota bacterium]